MNIYTKCAAGLFAALVISGCASSKYGDSGGSLCDSEMVQMGPDTYMATGKYGNGCGAKYKIRHAGIYCSRQGKEIMVQNVDNSPGGDVVFQCLRAGDQDLQRPVYERSPDVIIESK